MTGTGKHKGHSLSIRLSKADLTTIDRAARLRSRSRVGFIREAAVRNAENVLMENALPRMSENGFVAFMAAVSVPARPVPEMVELFGRKALWDPEPPTADPMQPPTAAPGASD